MKTILLILSLFVFLSCRSSSPNNITDVLMSGKKVKVVSPLSEGIHVFENISDANSHIEKLRGPFRVTIDLNVKFDDFFNIISGVARSGVGSVEVISHEDKNAQATLDFPLSDNNVSHWQFQVQDKFSWDAKTKSSGIDLNKNIAWLRVVAEDTSYKIDEKNMTFDKFKVLLQTMRNRHDRVAVGVLVANPRCNFIEILRLLATIEDEKCKAVIVSKEDG